MKGIITDIQCFCLTDGPGIRTTVFFQGCNMHCAWCHNPETIPMKPVLLHYRNKCIGCGKCLEVCPAGAHQIRDGEHVIDRKLCLRCGACAAKCFAGALVMSGREYTVEEVMRTVRQDKIYYEESGGGVTFSGGEVTLQTGFAVELTRACHAEGIPVAIETNMNRPFAELLPLLKEVDLIMCDLKIFSLPEHRRWTGVDSGLIENNIGRAGTLGKPMIVRTPLIPGATDSAENIRAIIRFLKSVRNVQQYELLNFNPLGAGKYTALDQKNPFENNVPFTRGQLEDFKAQLDAEGIRLKIS